jgi:hypothetical protein
MSDARSEVPTPMKCPRCEKDVSGRFCGICGAVLERRRCIACTASIVPGHRFCHECGVEQAAGGAPESGVVSPSARAPAPGPGIGSTSEGAPAPGSEVVPSPSGAPASDSPRRGWWVAAAAVAGGILFLSVPYVWTGWAEGGDGVRIPVTPPAATAPSGGTGVDLASMTPREAADRLFNRVMTAADAGDQGEVEAFLPMAIDAYTLVPDLDADGHFHLSLLQQTAGDHRAGLETAERALSSDPDHLLALYAAGEAARELGEAARAREHFSRLLDRFDSESRRDLPEYRDHASFLPTIQQAAWDFLAGEGP